jgi:hypothetical protein
MEVRTILSLHGLKAIRDAFNGWRIRLSQLGQTRQTRVAALWAAECFIPLVGHSAPVLGIFYDSESDIRLFKTAHFFKLGHC